MAVHWNVQSHLKLVTVVAEGDVTRSDIQSYLDMVIGANIVDWRRLFDARKGRAIFTNQDVNELGVRIREAAAVRVVGPMAFVLPEIETPEFRRFLGFLATARRPMKLFREIDPARRWIMKAPAEPLRDDQSNSVARRCFI